MDPVEQVLQAFNELDGDVLPPQALAARLRERTMDAEQAVSAINTAIESGALVQTENQWLRLPDPS